jgi:hypothetical protein
MGVDDDLDFSESTPLHKFAAVKLNHGSDEIGYMLPLGRYQGGRRQMTGPQYALRPTGDACFPLTLHPVASASVPESVLIPLPVLEELISFDRTEGFGGRLYDSHSPFVIGRPLALRLKGGSGFFVPYSSFEKEGRYVYGGDVYVARQRDGSPMLHKCHPAVVPESALMPLPKYQDPVAGRL